MRRALLLFITISAGAQSQWPAQLELDVETQSWEAAIRVGSALLAEIDAGRMLPGFGDIQEEARLRRLYAEALDHSENREEAVRQRALADAVAANREGVPGYKRRLVNLKTSVLAAAIDQPSSLPRDSIVIFWAEWCALCKPELEALAAFPGVVKIDADRMDHGLQRYVPFGELPQLYIVDPAGHIRFHVAGFQNDGFFSLKVRWMLDAAHALAASSSLRSSTTLK